MRKYFSSHLEALESEPVGGSDECWVWSGSKTANSYGVITCGGVRKYAHRVAMEKAVGRSLAPHEHVCHRCDNPPCFNPSHLFVGSRKDNMADRDAKMRQPHGEKNGQSRLTEEQVLEIRAIGRSMPQMRIAEMYGIKGPTVNNILTGKRWPHVGGPRVDPATEHANKRWGERHSMVKLTEAKVMEIKRMASVKSRRQLAREYAVDKATIARIIDGKTWRGVAA